MVLDKEFLAYEDGIFKPHFEKFIQYKRSKGEKVTHSALIRMKHLNNALNKYGTLEITQQMTEEVLAPKLGISEVTRYARITHLRQFLAFLKIFGINCCQLPPRYTRSIRCRFRPYIFNDDEINRIISAADNLRKWQHRERRSEIYPIIMRILIGTGMRISEVLILRHSDIDPDNGVIKAINGKNGVSRYIPVTDNLNSAIKTYMSAYGVEDYLFKSPKTGRTYSYDTVKAMFGKLCATANIYRADGRTPNIHSLRHTFCSKSLEQMLDSGMDLYTAIPILAAYVGHVNFRDTESYIHFTEKAYQDFLDKQEPLRRIIPEVECDER
jgi:integrase